MGISIIFSNSGDADCILIKQMLERIPKEVIGSFIEIKKGEEIPYYDMIKAMHEEKDTILFIGHGTLYGMLSPDLMEYMVWESHFIDHVKADRVILWWCYASEFINQGHLTHHLKSSEILATGMFISNAAEATMEKITATQEEIDKTNTSIYEMLVNMMVSTNTLDGWVDNFQKSIHPDNEIDVFNKSRIKYYKYVEEIGG